VKVHTWKKGKVFFVHPPLPKTKEGERHMTNDTSQPLSESLFEASMRFSESINFNLSRPERQVFCLATNLSLADATIELSTQSLLVCKRLKE